MKLVEKIKFGRITSSCCHKKVQKVFIVKHGDEEKKVCKECLNKIIECSTCELSEEF